MTWSRRRMLAGALALPLVLTGRSVLAGQARSDARPRIVDLGSHLAIDGWVVPKETLAGSWHRAPK